MPRIEMYDTTLRDGSQGEGVNFSVEDKLHITQRLDDLGIDYIEGGYPLSNPKDAEYFQRVGSLPLKHAKLAAFGMTRRRGIKAAEDVGMQALAQAKTPIITIVGKTWDLHVTEVLAVDLAENLAMIADSVRFCKSVCPTVFYDAEHCFDGLRANRDYALQTLRTARDAGADVIVCCDTNGGSLPDWVAEVMDLLGKDVGIALGIHCHNDSDLATANSLAAVAHGATQVQGTINGIGERCGNTDLVAVIANLMLKQQREVLPDPSRLAHLTEASRFVYDAANMNFRANQPFVGGSAFAHKGGMHVHAVARVQHSYEHIRPESVGNERRVLVSELSGQSNIKALGGGKYSLAPEQTKTILGQVQDLEYAGYQFEGAEASFDLLMRKVIGRYQPSFKLLHYRVNVEMETQGAGSVTEATVKVKVNDRIEHTVAEGDGPVNALDAALRKALEPFYQTLQSLRLVDYKVRVVNSKAGTAARVRVLIESRDDTEVWGTVGVHENIIEASWLALVDSIEYKLHKDR